MAVGGGGSGAPAQLLPIQVWENMVRICNSPLREESFLHEAELVEHF